MKGKLHVKLGIFGAVPLVLLRDRTVTGSELRVYIALSSFEGTKAESYPAVRTIADRAGVSKSSVSPATASLSCKGWIKVTRRGQGQSNLYECLSFSDRVREAHSRLIRKWKKDGSGKFQKTGHSEFKDSVGSDGKQTGPVGNKKTTRKDHSYNAPLSTEKGGKERSPLSEQNKEKEAAKKQREEVNETMDTTARERGSDLSYRYARVKSMRDHAFGKNEPATVTVSFSESVGELLDEGRVSVSAIIKAWSEWTATQPASKWRFFVESYSRVWRRINDGELKRHAEVKRSERGTRSNGYWKDGKYVEGEALHVGGGPGGSRGTLVATRASAEAVSP
jgi:DNA-binding MarR family transcriptional regulator